MGINDFGIRFMKKTRLEPLRKNSWIYW